jgi:adenylate kinase family enzyme
MKRIAVIGTAGSGKSTIAATIAQMLDVPRLELDSVHWQENWTRAQPEQMRAEVAEFMTVGGWVIDGNYRGILGNRVLDAADTVVWVDPTRSRMITQSARRSIRRTVTREELWNGNREPRADFFLGWRDHSVLTWARAIVDMNRPRYRRILQQPENSHLTVVRLRDRGQTDDFLAQLQGPRRIETPQE